MLVNMLDKKIELMPQETGGTYKFGGRLFMTQGFSARFGELSGHIAVNTIRAIIRKRVNSSIGADYLQVCKYQGIRYWVIDDIDHVTVLLPEEY